MECSCGKTTNLLIEADFGDAVWCAVCKVNLDVDELPVSGDLKQQLEDWTRDFGKWIDWDSDLLKNDADKTEGVFNQKGEVLVAKLREALPSFTITYQPSNLCLLYGTAGR
ncbi:hypothetical protein SAMN05421503_2849 [Terribacillus aidingensis]|uniref:Uncharacterized protein n=1 Tax=Terribacillus aidingensis TaxID=586416 RepID=A0A285P2W5_9BACI|nr:hypothetical protein [Terribacillus aidingensis]SNZ16072.1 hypothetical protein SAMN05421503_2849 [Terribacillus aidingensis]